MTESKVDLEAVTRVQRTLAREALETAPADVTKFKITASDGGGSIKTKVDAATPFLLNDEAVAALRKLLLLYSDAGIPLKAVVFEFAEKPDGNWGMVAEYDYQ